LWASLLLDPHRWTFSGSGPPPPPPPLWIGESWEGGEAKHNGAAGLWQLGRCAAERGMGRPEDRLSQQLAQPASS